jgi:hypothetical protein
MHTNSSSLATLIAIRHHSPETTVLRWISCCLLTLACVLTFARHSTADEAADFRLTNGTTLTGTLVALNDESILISVISESNTLQRTVPLEQLVDYRRSLPDGWVWPQPSRTIWLTNGDVVHASLQSMNDSKANALWVSNPDWPLLELESAWVKGAHFNWPGSKREQETWLRVLDRPTANDTAILQNGDKLTGELIELDAAMLKLQPANGPPTPLARSQVSGLRLNDELAVTPTANARNAKLLLSNGSQLTVTGLAVADGLLTAELAGTYADTSQPMRMPIAEVISIEFHAAGLVWVTDLTAIEASHVPFLGITATSNRLARPSYRVGRAWDGGPAQTGSGRFVSGFGTLTGTTIKFTTGSEPTKFSVGVGLDVSNPPDCVGEVLVEANGETVFRQDDLERGKVIRVPAIELPANSTVSLVSRQHPRARRDYLLNWYQPILAR